MRIAFIDDHTLLLEGLKSLSEKSFEDYSISCFASASELLEQSDQDFDLLVTDIDMPKMSGTELISKIRAFSSDQKILVLSMHKDIQLIQVLKQLNVNGYLPKDSAPEFLNQAIQLILEGGTFWPAKS